jgi:hypothetical protein
MSPRNRLTEGARISVVHGVIVPAPEDRNSMDTELAWR